MKTDIQRQKLNNNCAYFRISQLQYNRVPSLFSLLFLLLLLLLFISFSHFSLLIIQPFLHFFPLFSVHLLYFYFYNMKDLNIKTSISPVLDLCLSAKQITNLDLSQTQNGSSHSLPKTNKLCSRGHWRPAEDDKLKQLVLQFGPQNWNLIALNLQGRSGNHFFHSYSHSLLITFNSLPLCC